MDAADAPGPLRAWHDGRRNITLVMGGVLLAFVGLASASAVAVGSWIGAVVLIPVGGLLFVGIRHVLRHDWVELDAQGLLTVAGVLGEVRVQVGPEWNMHPKPWVRRYTFVYLQRGRRLVHLTSLSPLFDYCGSRRGDYDELMARLEAITGNGAAPGELGRYP